MMSSSRIFIGAKFCLALSAISLFSGCSSVLKTEHNSVNGYELFSSTAGTRNVVVRQKSDSYHFCSEPFPDAAVDRKSSFAFDLSLIQRSDETSDSNGLSEASLGGRSVNVLITREVLFRTCEFISNAELTAQQQADMFKQALSTVQQINAVNLGDGSSDEAKIQSVSSASVDRQ